MPFCNRDTCTYIYRPFHVSSSTTITCFLPLFNLCLSEILFGIMVSSLYRYNHINQEQNTDGFPVEGTSIDKSSEVKNEHYIHNLLGIPYYKDFFHKIKKCCN